jgi:hypothetical protein
MLKAKKVKKIIRNKKEIDYNKFSKQINEFKKHNKKVLLELDKDIIRTANDGNEYFKFLSSIEHPSESIFYKYIKHEYERNGFLVNYTYNNKHYNCFINW